MRREVFQYVFTVLVCILGFVVKLLLIRLIQYPESGFLLSLGTIMVSAWFGGFRSGLLAVFINYIIIDWVFITPGKLFFNDPFVDQVRFSFFVIEGILISYLFESLHRANRKTRESLLTISQNEKFSRSLIENIKDYALFLIDSRGNILTWNEGAVAMTGYEANEILQKEISIISLPLEITIIDALRAAKRNEQYYKEGWGMRKGGSLFWQETIITPLPSVSAKNQTFSVILHDITARKKIDDLKSEFITIVAHELRTPVAIMKLILENLLVDKSKKSGLNNEWHELLDLHNEVSRLSLLIDNIVDITRLKTKKFILNYQRIELSSVITNVVNRMRLIAGENHSIIFSPTHKITILVDQLRIEQVLINLLDNAIKFTPQKGKIVVSLKIEKKTVVVSVFNETTAELPKDKYLLIFDKFYQLTKRPVKGFGLGLYISREIIKQHKGKISVSSQAGKGNTFSFILPKK